MSTRRTDPLRYYGVYVGAAVVQLTSFFGMGLAPSLVTLNIPLDGGHVATSLRVFVAGVNGLVAQCTVTVYKNNVATALTLTIGAGAVGSFSATGNVVFADTDRIDLVIDSTGAGVGAMTFGASIGLS